MAARELITQAEYARRRGATPAAVCKAIRRCGIPLVDGKLDPLVADVLWKARTDPVQQRRALGQNRAARQAVTDESPPAEDSDWTGRRLRAEARLAELELQEREGSLVSRAEVERGAKRIAFTLVALLTPIADRVAAEFGVDDAHRRRLRQRIAEEIDQVRAEVARAGLVAEQ